MHGQKNIKLFPRIHITTVCMDYLCAKEKKFRSVDEQMSCSSPPSDSSLLCTSNMFMFVYTKSFCASSVLV